MREEIQLQVSPEIAAHEEALMKEVSRKLAIASAEIRHLEVLKRSIDARQRKVKINLKLGVFVDEDFEEVPIQLPDYPDVSQAQEVIVVGAGPAGLFAALRLIEKGLKPIVLERGKDVKNRRRDLAAITRAHIVNEDSNYCFGEGGAGTYSDGKLYTRSKKRGDVQRILHLLVAHGAHPDIMVDAHPHIGTNKLPQIVTAVRETIIRQGGKVVFDAKVSDILIQQNEVKGVRLERGDILEASKLILATGHSARDIFALLQQKGIRIEAKPFALGVRVEHSQTLIDSVQYNCESRGDYLPPAPYNIVRQVQGRGVYSFCMCPGGIIAPCATAPGEVVTNGWSPSKRNQPTSNSGIVVELKVADFKEYQKMGPLAGVEFQKSIEQKAWTLAGKTQKVPAQRLVDFTQGKVSQDIPFTSYLPGTSSVELGEVLPSFIYRALQEGFRQFGKAMRGYLTNEAVVHAPESRTSSPVRIPRDYQSLEHVEVKGLYPCGEGAGYAGGIISAAIDGEKCAEQCAISLGKAQRVS
ncbi:putative FAD-dependent dehydrogenase [Catalinimonas alkaloidigena]|uniref:NAD(P)/FAD-dependent oxidoreductase n=1 Tax=Catalinimonas alkaloidigena TaxID=1075417 RepID=UPI002405DC05|nr:NAD(P)/FAD-dependent oxidoreductase [Catalinimonas alkaloidigena]MDF9795259.1 putative FAD-dependent dehydrogenase [Catalinimonas alkaloidigena]